MRHRFLFLISSFILIGLLCLASWPHRTSSLATAASQIQSHQEVLAPTKPWFLNRLWQRVQTEGIRPGGVLTATYPEMRITGLREGIMSSPEDSRELLAVGDLECLPEGEYIGFVFSGFFGCWYVVAFSEPTFGYFDPDETGGRCPLLIRFRADGDCGGDILDWWGELEIQ